MSEHSDAGIYRWIECPECGSNDIRISYNNGRLSLSCDECYQACSKLVGRATFR